MLHLVPFTFSISEECGVCSLLPPDPDLTFLGLLGSSDISLGFLESVLLCLVLVVAVNRHFVGWVGSKNSILIFMHVSSKFSP